MKQVNLDLTPDMVSAALARRSHEEFMRFAWKEPSPFAAGIHTKIICERIDKAIEDYRQGKSTFLSIKCAFRMGKSHIVSRFLPPRFLGLFPDDDMIVVAHTASLVRTFSRYARNTMQDPKYQLCFPGTYLSKTEASVDSWGVEGKMGKCMWVGLDSGITGRGGRLIVIDDFFRNREEAESESTRDKVWTKILHDVLTRRGDPSIVIVLATPWHIDDPFGRIKTSMEDPTFPQFEELKFPYKSDEYPKMIKGHSKYLFPERFTAHWYETQASMLGPYGRASLFECEPTPRHGNLLRVDKIDTVEKKDLPEGLMMARGWDLASSTKQRIRDNPDYTVGLKIGVKWTASPVPGHDVPTIYVLDMIRGRWEASQRDRVISQAAVADGTIPIGAEAFGPYKDAYTNLSKILFGIRTVQKIQLPGDKASKYLTVEPSFATGNVKMLRAPWNETFIDEVSKAPAGPSGVKDDIPDAFVVAMETLKPYHKRLMDRFSGGERIERLKIPWNNLQSPTRMVISLWMDKNKTTSVLVGMWWEQKNQLWILMEKAFETPRPEYIVPMLTYMMRQYTSNKVPIIVNSGPAGARFEWIGNDVMFAANAKDIRNAFQNYNVWLQPNRRYNEDGAVLLVNRLIKRNRLRLDDTAQEVLMQVNGWCMQENRLVDGHGFAKALTSMVSFLDESGYIRPEKPPFGGEYTPKRTKMHERAGEFVRQGRPDEFDPSVVPDKGGKDDWMKV